MQKEKILISNEIKTNSKDIESRKTKKNRNSSDFSQKKKIKKIKNYDALARVSHLYRLARHSNHLKNHILETYYLKVLRGVAQKRVLALDSSIKGKFCKKCYRFFDIVNNVENDSRFFVEDGLMFTKLSCPSCGEIKKKIFRSVDTDENIFD